MSKLIVLALCLAVAEVLAEPPSSYLPPQARGSLSNTYGAPNGGFRSNGHGNGNGNGHGNGNGKSSSFHAQRTGSQSFSYNSIHESQFGGSQKSFGLGKSFNGNGFGGPGALSQQYGAPSQLYKAPGQNGFGGRNGNGFGVSQQYGAPKFGSSSNGFGVSEQYGAPSFGATGNGFGASSNGFGVSQQYGAPAFGASGNGFGGISNGFGAQSFSSKTSNHRFGSSGATFGNGYSNGNGNGHSNGNGFHNGHGNGYSNGHGNGYSNGNGNGYRNGNGNGYRNGNGNGYSAPAPVYGAPSAKYGAPYSKMDDDLAEPANYEYTYEVQAAEESGAEFGHQESREDEAAKGVYHVLLPDGRTQIVEYEADEEGFRPVIRYEEPTGYPEASGPQGPY